MWLFLFYFHYFTFLVFSILLLHFIFLSSYDLTQLDSLLLFRPFSDMPSVYDSSSES